MTAPISGLPSSLHTSSCFLFLSPVILGGKDQGNGRLTSNYIKVFNETRGLVGGYGPSLQPFPPWALPQNVILSSKLCMPKIFSY